MIALQKSFSSGLNQIVDDSQIDENGYVWLVNGRNRFGPIEPTKKHIEIENAPSGIKQGIIAVGNILVIFVAGRAYYQRDGDADWTMIPNFQMSTTEYQYWTQTIPASTFNFARRLDVGANIHAPIIANVDFKLQGSPAGILVQDGINQPWLIEYDSTNQIFMARITKSFIEWNNQADDGSDREYVPIGKQMMFMNQTLFIVSKDYKVVYRSITGRPLDFMINVDVNGNKAPTESIGGAFSLSFAFDFDDITCIQALDIPDSFVYATEHNTRIITADYTRTLFGEPTFRETAKIRSGIVNQYSFSDSLGDYVHIDFDGVKSFNAVQQLKFKGSNSIFSLQLSKLLHNVRTGKPIKQQYCSVINYNNYLLFNLDTTWDNLTAVYDTLKQQWVGLDITEAARVKQFAIVHTTTEQILYCITKLNKVFKMYSSEISEVAELRVKGFVVQETDVEHKSQYLRLMFDGGTYDGEVVLREFVDQQESYGAYTRLPLKAKVGSIKYPIIPPVIPGTEQRTENPSFSLTTGLTGKKIAFIVSWTNNSLLIEFKLSTSEMQDQASQRQKENTYTTN